MIDGKMTDLGVLPGKKGSEAVAINASGQVVGYSYTRAENASSDVVRPRAFMWQNGKLTDLGTLPDDTSSRAVAINRRGQVIGYSYRKTDQFTSPVSPHAFLWENGRMTDLGTLPGGKESHAAAINEHNQIVGWSTTKTSQTHAVLWTLRPVS